MYIPLVCAISDIAKKKLTKKPIRKPSRLQLCHYESSKSLKKHFSKLRLLNRFVQNKEFCYKLNSREFIPDAKCL